MPMTIMRILFSEAPSGLPPVLHYWFPVGKTWGYEFVTPASLPAPERSEPPMQLHRRDDGHEHRAVANPADSPALNEALAQIASGKLGPRAIASAGTTSSRRIPTAHLRRSCWRS